MSTTKNTKKRKRTRLEEQCLKLMGKKPIGEKVENTIKFFKTSNVESGKRYTAPRKRSPETRGINVRTRNIGISFVLAVFMLCAILTANSEALSAYFTDIKNANNPFSVDAEYTVTFDSNTGTGTMPAQIVSYNVATPLNANTFTKTDYVFTGWNTNANGTGTAYAPGASINNLGDITLYAQWIESTNCTITYVYGDETFDGSNYINSGIPLFSSGNIHRDFEVRSTISNFTVNPGQNNARNVLICNQNEAGNPYPGFAMSYREDKEGNGIKIQGNCTETAQMMVFWGKESGTVVITRTDDKLYYDDNNFLVDYANIVTPFNAPLSFGANLDQNGNPRRYAKVTMSDTEVKITYSQLEIPTLVLPTPTRTGYVFKGWYTDPVGGTKITTPTIEQLANKKIYARWAEPTSTYTITFNSNGGTGIMNDQDIDYGVSTALSSNTFTMDDAVFQGWNTAADGTGTHYDDEEMVTDLGDKALYAEWDENKHPVTFFYGDESFVGNNYIDSGIGLFSSANIKRDFVLSLDITRFSVLTTFDRNTILTNHYEQKSPNPGISFVYRDKALGAQANRTRLKESFITWNQVPGTIEFKREGTIVTFNNQLLMDFANTNNVPFESNLIFGTNISENGQPRRYCDADVENVSLTFEYTKREFPLTSLPTPTRTGYTFDGWYTAATGGTQVTSLSYSDYETAYNNDGYYKLYPHWTANP